MEVLNISTTNTVGAVVLNDLQLLELIQLYPFMFNQRVRPNLESDYEDWAWKRITEAFNRHYIELKRQFTTNELCIRWEALKPIIKSLSNLYDMSAIPKPLRIAVTRISAQLENAHNDSDTPLKPLTSAQNVILQNMEMVKSIPLTSAQTVILQNMEMVKSLPSSELRRLEAEVMELLLSTELEATPNTLKIDAVNMTNIEKEYHSFINELGFKDIFSESIFKNNVPPQNSPGDPPDHETPANTIIPLIFNVDTDSNSSTKTITAKDDDNDVILIEDVLRTLSPQPLKEVYQPSFPSEAIITLPESTSTLEDPLEEIPPFVLIPMTSPIIDVTTVSPTPEEQTPMGDTQDDIPTTLNISMPLAIETKPIPTRIKVKLEICSTPVQSLKRKTRSMTTTPVQPTATMKLRSDLTRPLIKERMIPLSDVHLHIRNLRVRVKRLHLKQRVLRSTAKKKSLEMYLFYL